MLSVLNKLMDKKGNDLIVSLLAWACVFAMFIGGMSIGTKWLWDWLYGSLSQISPKALGAVAFLVGATNFLTFLVTFKWMTRVVTSRMTGISEGVGEVMNAANETADLKVRVSHGLRTPAPVNQQPELILPPADVSYRIASSTRKIIEG